MEKDKKACFCIDRIKEMTMRRMGKEQFQKTVYFDSARIKEVLLSLIESDCNYLLTDGLLFYVASMAAKQPWSYNEIVIDLLKSLMNEDERVVTITRYIEAIRYKEPLETFTGYRGLLNEYETILYYEYCDNLKIIWDSDLIIPADYHILRRVFQIFTAYALVNNLSKEDLHNLIINYTKDRRNKLEELLLHVCRLEYNYAVDDRRFAYDIYELTKFVVGKLSDNNQRVIR